MVDNLAELSTNAQLDKLESLMTAHLVYNFGELRTKLATLNRAYFRNENFLIYNMLSEVASEISVGIDLDYLKIYLSSHKNLIPLDKDRLELESYASEDLDEVSGLILSTVEVFERYLNESSLEGTTFDDVFAKFKVVFSKLSIIDTATTAVQSLETPIWQNRRKLSGVEGAMDIMSQGVGAVRALNGQDSFKIMSAKDASGVEAKRQKPTFLCNFLDIPTFDAHVKGLYTDTLVTMVAPEKGMKSKMAIRVSHSVLMNGFNVSFWGKEGSFRKVMAEMRATHYDYYYNVLGHKNISKISGTDIMRGLLKPDEEALEQISFDDLVKNPNYGELFLPDYPFYYEHAETVVRESAGLGCKLVVIDYGQLLSSLDGRMTKTEVLARVYPIFESLKGELDICLWIPSQMRSEAVRDFGKGNMDEYRTITAESSEPTKSADLNILLYTNQEMERQRKATLYVLQSRICGSLDPVPVFTDPLANNIIEMREDSNVL